MDILKRATQRTLQEWRKPAASASDPQLEDDFSMADLERRDPVVGWRRIMLKANLVLQAAMQQALLMEFQDVWMSQRRVCVCSRSRDVEALSCEPSGSRCEDKAVRFEDGAEVHRCRDLCTSDHQAERELTCSLVELQQLSSQMAKIGRRDSHRGLSDVEGSDSRLLLDPDTDEEDEQFALSTEDWCTLWIDTCHPQRVEAGKVPMTWIDSLDEEEYTGRYLCAGVMDAAGRKEVLSHDLPTMDWTGVILPELRHETRSGDLASYGWYHLSGTCAYVLLHPPSDRMQNGLEPRYDAPPYVSVIQVVNADDDLCLRSSQCCWLTMGKRARHRKIDKQQRNLMSVYSFDKDE
eukprot:3770589-Amphidinium_carterae.1